MFVTNNKKTVIDFKYKVAGLTKSSPIPVNATLEFPSVTSIYEVVFSPIDTMKRQINAKFNRGIDTGVIYSNTLGGTPL